jgi:WD40 repeat protein
MGDQEQPLKASPSLLYQNLSFGENKFVYVHKTEAHSFNVQSKEPSSFQLKDKSAVHQTRVLFLGWGTTLLVASHSGAHFWDLVKEKPLFSVPIDNEGKPNFMLRGITSIENNVFIGLSSGAIFVISTSKDGAQLLQTLKQHREVITDIASGTVDREALLVSSDLTGEIIIWNPALEVKSRIEPQHGDVCTSIAVSSAHIVCGYGSGKLRLFTPTGKKYIEIAAHCRWINSIAYATRSELLATVSEDMLLQFWQLPNTSTGKAAHVGSRLIKDCLLCGVAFTADGLRVGCTAYDTEKLFLFDVPR